MNKRRKKGKKSSKVGCPTIELFLLAVLVIDKLSNLYHQTGLS